MDKARRCAAFPPPPGEPGMKGERVEKPGDDRPGFLGIPTPVSAPGLVGPDRPGDDTGGEPHKTKDDGFAGEIIDGGQWGQAGKDGICLLRALALLFEQIHHPQATGNGKGSVTYEAGDHMGDEPVDCGAGISGLI